MTPAQRDALIDDMRSILAHPSPDRCRRLGERLDEFGQLADSSRGKITATLGQLVDSLAGSAQIDPSGDTDGESDTDADPED